MFPLLLILQAAVVETQLEGVDFDLRKLPAERSDDIVVTARRPDPKLPKVVDKEPEYLLPRAEFDLFGGVRAGFSVEQQAMVGGAVSNRVMLTLKKKF